MNRHIDLLARLHKIWGALAAVAGVSILIQAVGTMALNLTAGPLEPAGRTTAGLLAIVFFIFAAAALAFGGAHIFDGIGLRRRKPWARPVALVLGLLNLFFLPFGTALAVYAFWVLLTDETRQAFDPTRPPDTSAQ